MGAGRAAGESRTRARPYNLSVKPLLAAALLLWPVLATGQAPAAGTPEEPPTFTESAGAEYVMLPVLVTDKKGRFAEGLRKEDFVLKVGDTRVPVDTFDRDESAPVSFAFLVDTSGSMGVGHKLDEARHAIRAIVSARTAGDDFALFDAVAATPERMMKGRNNKRAILLFTDGVDNASELTAEKMAELLQRVSVPVYPIGMKNAAFDALSEKERQELSVDTLQMLAASSGGKLHLVSGDDDLRPLASQISREVRQQYLLGFAPSGKGDIKYRIVVVSVIKPGSWVVRTRRGYRGTAPGGS